MDNLIREIRAFNRERNWEQFHSPKNLAMALSVEVAEIVEHLQWLTQQESRDLDPEKVDALREEIGDALIYLMNLADKLGINPLGAAQEKLEKNRAKYPVDHVKGKSLKYSEYE